MALSLTGNGYGSDIVLDDKVLDNIEPYKAIECILLVSRCIGC